MWAGTFQPLPVPRHLACVCLTWGNGKNGPFVDSTSPDWRYRLLIEAVTDYAIYMLDPTGIVTSWNPGAQRFKGYTAAEIIGQHFSRFYTEEDREARHAGAGA